MNEQTDQQALALTHAIALSESGHNGSPNYNAVGDNGSSHGAYQWQPGNFASAAKTAGLDPTDMSPVNQDKVAYSEVKAYKDKGYDPGQIASMWNSGSPNNWQNHAGTTTVNGKPLSYDTPAYVKKVQGYYQQLSGSQGDQQNQSYNPTPYSNPNPGQFDLTGTSATPSTSPAPDTSTIGGQLAGRLNDASSGLTQVSKGGIENIASGALQTVGAGAGAIGDVVNDAVSLIPGVKQLEGIVGGALGKAANTPQGQQVMAAAKNFAQAHPEAVKNLGAIGNIASVIPVFKGIGEVADLGKSAVAKIFEDKLAQSTENELTGAIGNSQQARNFMAKSTINGSSPFKDIVNGIGEDKTRILPDVVAKENGAGHVYSTGKADELASNIESQQEEKLRSILQDASSKAVQPGSAGFTAELDAANSPITLTEARQEAINLAKKTMGDNPEVVNVIKKINSNFDFLNENTGGTATLDRMTDMKRDVRTGVKFDMPSHEKDAAFYTGQGLMKSVENTASKRGISGVREINQQMGKTIRVRQALGKLEGKTVKSSKIGRFSREAGADVASAAGELTGRALGIPIAGTFAGRAIGRAVAGRAPGGAMRLLAHEGKGIGAGLVSLGKKAPLAALHNTQQSQ